MKKPKAITIFAKAWDCTSFSAVSGTISIWIIVSSSSLFIAIRKIIVWIKPDIMEWFGDSNFYTNVWSGRQKSFFRPFNWFWNFSCKSQYSLAQPFSYEFCEIFKNTCFNRTPLVATSVQSTLKWMQVMILGLFCNFFFKVTIDLADISIFENLAEVTKASLRVFLFYIILFS